MFAKKSFLLTRDDHFELSHGGLNLNKQSAINSSFQLKIEKRFTIQPNSIDERTVNDMNACGG